MYVDSNLQLHTEDNPICATQATRLTLRPLALHTMYTTYVNDMQLKVILFPFALAKQTGRQAVQLDELRWRTGLTVPSRNLFMLSGIFVHGT